MRLIDVDKLTKRFKQLKGVDSLANMFITDVVKEIQRQPTVEAVPVVHGEWKRVGSGSLYDVYECTNCHCPPKWDCLGDNHWKIAFTDFCPNCGADMRKKV